MTLTIWMWLGPALVAGLGMILMTWWSVKHPKYNTDAIVKLSDFILGAFMALCPIVNVFTAIGMVVYFMSEIAPNIVLVGKKP